jgi:hypothetical protein
LDWIEIYDGPTVLADMLREELRHRGVRAVVHAAGPYLGIIGDAARTPYSVIKVPDAELELHREAIEECLALVHPDAIIAEDTEPGDPS